MLIAEVLLLISHLDGKGNLVGSSGDALDLTVCGGLLAELFLMGRLRLHDDKLEVVDGSSSGDIYLDRAQEQIAPSFSFKEDDGEWIGPLIGQMPFGNDILERMIGQGVIGREEKRSLGVFRSTKYFLRDPFQVKQFREQERQIMINGQAPDARSATLLFLTNILGDANPTRLSRGEKKVFRRRWEALFGDYWGWMPSENPIPISDLAPQARYGIGGMIVSLGTVRSYGYSSDYGSYV